VFGLAGMLALALACNRQSAAPSSPSGHGAGPADETAAADGSTLKVTAPQALSPINDAQTSEAPVLTASTSAAKYGTAVDALQYRFQVFGETGAMVQDSGLVSAPSFRVTAPLTFKRRHTWRVRAESQGLVGPWSPSASPTPSFVSAEGGYVRGDELFDPLYNGQSIAQSSSCSGCGIVGTTTFMGDKGIRLDAQTSHVRYIIPQSITSGEFSVEVEGLRANAPGDKSKVFGMQQGFGDFIVDPYRVDIQYRGINGAPPNAITFRAIYGDADDLDVRYEPPTAVRFASARILDPSTRYFWKASWGSIFRLTVQEGGANDNGRVIYDFSVPSPDGIYRPVPHVAYLGAPIGRSGSEAATIPGTIYRNLYIGTRPRPF
jgi:hypothetical protein